MNPERIEYEALGDGNWQIYFVVNQGSEEISFGPYEALGNLDAAKGSASSMLAQDVQDLDLRFFEEDIPTINRGASESSSTIGPTVRRCAALLILIILLPSSNRNPVKKYEESGGMGQVAESSTNLQPTLHEESLYESLSTLANPGDQILARQFRACRLNGDPKGYAKAFLFYQAGLKTPGWQSRPYWPEAKLLVEQVGRDGLMDAFRSHPVQGVTDETFDSFLSKEF